MINIALTDFLDFMSVSGAAKLDRVAAFKRGAASESYPDNLFEGATENGRFAQGGLQAFFDFYRQRSGSEKIVSKSMTECAWQYNRLIVRVNPELYLLENGREQIIKFYTKKSSLPRNMIDIALLLIKMGARHARADARFTLYEVCRNRIWTKEKPNIKLTPLLKGEAQNFMTIYENLP